MAAAPQAKNREALRAVVMAWFFQLGVTVQKPIYTVLPAGDIHLVAIDFLGAQK
jgi:hypothetical protein